jgi:hypothetical protein
MLRTSLMFVVFLLAATGCAFAQDEGRKPLPDHLTFGYDDEGKIDDSPKACEAAAHEMVEWSEEETRKAAADICTARKRHVDAYAAIQKSYKALVKHIEPDHRLNPAESIASFEAMIKACIGHKMNINTGGHNIYIDIIPNDVAAACLKLGKDLLDDETAWFDKGGWTEDRPAP